jgi:dTMP kinase
LQPDLTLLFDVPLEVARERLDATRTLDKFESEEAAFFQRCRNEYLRRAAASGGRIVVVDSTRTIDEVRASLRDALEKWL